MADLFTIPNYVKAASPFGLRRLMFRVQLRDRMQYKFFDIAFVDGFWFAWYFKNTKSDVEKLEVSKELNSKE